MAGDGDFRARFTEGKPDIQRCEAVGILPPTKLPIRHEISVKNDAVLHILPSRLHCCVMIDAWV